MMVLTEVVCNKQPKIIMCSGKRYVSAYNLFSFSEVAIVTIIVVVVVCYNLLLINRYFLSEN